ncbi:MAG: hypothetical protein ABIU95_03630 [Burkholderiales bacterium]
MSLAALPGVASAQYYYPPPVAYPPPCFDHFGRPLPPHFCYPRPHWRPGYYLAPPRVVIHPHVARPFYGHGYAHSYGHSVGQGYGRGGHLRH